MSGGGIPNWFTLAEGVAVFAILGSDILNHYVHNHDVAESKTTEREELISKVSAGLAHDTLSIEIDPAFKSHPAYQAAKEMLDTPLNAQHVKKGIIPADGVPVLISGEGAEGTTLLKMKLNANEMREAGLAAQHLMNPELADILAHTPDLKTIAKVKEKVVEARKASAEERAEAKEARKAQSIAADVPHSSVSGGAAAQEGRLASQPERAPEA